MDSHLLESRAFSLTELALLLCVIALVASVVFPMASVIRKAAYQIKTVNNLKAVGQACQDYYRLNGQWPDQLNKLVPLFLSSQSNLHDFTISLQDHLLTISSETGSITVTKPARSFDFTNF